MAYASLVKAQMAEEWKLWSCLKNISSLLLSFTVNSRADLEDPRLNTLGLSKRALIKSLENQKQIFFKYPTLRLAEKAIMHD